MVLKTKFCVKCGRETKDLVDSKCMNCYFVEKGIHLPKKTAVQVCKECKAINWKGVWAHTSYSPKHYLVMDLLSKTKAPEGVEVESVEIKKLGKAGEAEITVNLFGKKLSQVYSVELNVIERRCPACTKRLSKQHEAVIQIRADAELVRKITPYLSKYKTNIIKVEEQKKGIDIYMLSKSAARHLAAELRKHFRLKKKESFKAYSWDKAKNKPKYRVAISLYT